MRSSYLRYASDVASVCAANTLTQPVGRSVDGIVPRLYLRYDPVCHRFILNPLSFGQGVFLYNSKTWLCSIVGMCYNLNMPERMNRSTISVLTHKEQEQLDRDYWVKATVREKFETIVYLRECFYGPEATTGRLQRVYKVFKR